MAPDDAYRRRIAAILVGDVSGYSALVGQDDERTARAIEQLKSALRAIVVEANGYADTRAGDAIFASFDSVVAAVEAGLSIQRHVATQEFEGQRLQVRIGIHFGDVLVREGSTIGEGTGDAINIAARLQALARPGTICISEAVYVQVRERIDEHFVDLGHQQLKHIPYPVRAYLLVPSEHAADHRSGSWRVLPWLAALAALTVFAATILLVQRYRPHMPGATEDGERAAARATATPSEGQVVLGVMLFKRLGGESEADWRLEALRDSLNAQLSRLSRVKVYSKEFIDFLITRKGLTDIEAATELGISKMLSGSLMVTQGDVRIETHVVDVATGLLESSIITAGDEADFGTVQKTLVFNVISRLDLPVTEEEQQELAAQRKTDEEALKMLLEAEGAGAPEPKRPDDSSHERQLLPSRSLARLRVALVGTALAQEAGPQADILAVIERYRRAIETRDMQALAAVYVEFPAEQQTAQQRYFDNVRDLRITIENPEVAVVDDEAVVSYTRTDDFVDVRTGRPMHASVRLTKILRRVNGEWKMAAGK